jgi:hypothetical protein
MDQPLDEPARDAAKTGKVGQPGKQVFFHVGAPKTGTTYLQQVLFQNRELLATRGVLYPYEDFGQSFRSMQDFRGAGWGAHGPARYAGEWAAVAERTREWDGSTVIVSNELLGGSSPARIAAGTRSVQPADVHVIFTARDLARQLVSDWQEHVKHKHTVTLERFVDDLIELGHDAPAPFGELFWGMHDPGFVLGRWARDLPPENIHLITVPPPGAPRDTLWRRFCSVTGLDPDVYDTDTKRSNASMGVAETELVRRMNADLRDVREEDYDRLVRIVLAERVLGGGSPRLTLPTGRMDWVVDRSRRMVEDLLQAGYRIEGDLEELLPDPSGHTGYVSPTELGDEEIAPAALKAAVGMTRHAAALRQRKRDLEEELERPGAAVPPPRATARDVYWRVRGRVGNVLRRAGLKR